MDPQFFIFMKRFPATVSTFEQHSLILDIFVHVNHTQATPTSAAWFVWCQVIVSDQELWSQL